MFDYASFFVDATGNNSGLPEGLNEIHNPSPDAAVIGSMGNNSGLPEALNSSGAQTPANSISYVIVVTDMDPKPIMENLDAEINGDWETDVDKRNNYSSYFDGQQIEDWSYLVEKDNEIKEMAKEIEKVIQSKAQTVEKLEEAIEDLKGDLQIKGEEVTTLAETDYENVGVNIEVKIRLINQKLRVTEQTLNEKEGDHTGKEDKLHQENNSLRERISALSDSIANYKESQEFVKKEIT
ncbi:hypothetical protein Tco_0801496 [Tanacetum coccineum]|uniref:Uncharacterized protein n=1 Tax=Tanacetum coccineum TaxID=301880 RepID=A0ABQ4ZW90_9ASTR